MTTLEEKLKKIVGLVYLKGNNDGRSGDGKREDRVIAETPEQITKAFIDDGWVKVPTANISKDGIIEVSTDRGVLYNGIPMMTGQEWYDRFKGELLRTNCIHCTQPVNCLDTAKKAAGI